MAKFLPEPALATVLGLSRYPYTINLTLFDPVSCASIVNFSVIIPTLNEADHVASAIQSAWDAGASEVIVADGGSEDQTLSISKQMGARSISTSPGRGLQLNRGAELATEDILLFLHADNWLSPSCGNQLEEAVRSGHRFCCFRQRIDKTAWIYRWIEKGNSLRASVQKLPYGDQAISATRDLYDQVGGFDEIPLMEDVRFAQKASKFESPCLLNGPLNVSSRRWEKSGPIRQTISNWLMMTKFRLGFSPEKLAEQYNRINT